MPCRGLHCDGCKRGGGGIVAVIVLALILIGAAGKAAGSALAEVGHVLADVLEVALITVAVLAAVAVAAALGWVAVKVNRRRAARLSVKGGDRCQPRIMSAPHAAVVITTSAAARGVTAVAGTAEPQAIEAPKPVLTGLPLIRQEEEAR